MRIELISITPIERKEKQTLNLIQKTFQLWYRYINFEVVQITEIKLLKHNQDKISFKKGRLPIYVKMSV